MPNRKSLSTSTKQLVLHEAGYKCANAACRSIITLDIHHMEYVSEGGSDLPDNLLPLCPNCHALHHTGHIPHESIRAWKMLLLTLNEAFPRSAVDTLLVLSTVDELRVSGEGVLQCAGPLASKLIEVKKLRDDTLALSGARYFLSLSPKGRNFVNAWKAGNQRQAIESNASELP